MSKASITSENLAIAHDYLIQMGGAERVVALMARHFPESPIYTSCTDFEGLLPEFINREIHNSWIQKLPVPPKHFKKLFPLYPFAFQSMRPAKAKAAWISASTFAKCINVSPDTTTFCYCHAPTRFLWQADTYLKTEIRNPAVRGIVRTMLPLLRRIDRRAAHRMDYLIANSANTRDNIQKAYGLDADIIHPPVDIERFTIGKEQGEHYLIVARLIGYKGIDRAVQAFSGSGRELRIIGDGTDRERLESMASPNVTFLGKVSDAEVLRQMQSCRALIFPGEEDFGIAPVEAQACGKPVLAYGKGGALETVIHGETGIHFKQPTPKSLASGLKEIESINWDPLLIRRNAEQFSEERFMEKTLAYMEERLS